MLFGGDDQETGLLPEFGGVEDAEVGDLLGVVFVHHQFVAVFGMAGYDNCLLHVDRDSGDFGTVDLGEAVERHLADGALDYWACLGITLLLSFMMVSNLRCFSFKMKKLSWKGNEVRWIFLAVAVVGFVIFKWLALPFIMVLYILLSVFFGGKTEQ